MATDNSDPRNQKPVKIKRLQIGVNVLAQLITVALIVLMVNYIAFNHYKRWDYSRTHRYALSEKTKLVLGGLKKPVKVIVFFSTGGGDVYPDLIALLKEYQYASNKKLEIELVDPFRDKARSTELQAKYRFGQNENIVILDYEGRTKFVNAQDMGEYDRSGEMYGQPPKLKAFKGEQALTGAILEVSDDKQSKMLVLTGQGERDINDPSYSAIKTFIQRENILLQTLDLQEQDTIPAEARAIIILGPRYDFSELQIKQLKDYWEKKGRLFLLLDPTAQTPRLSAFLNEQCIKPDDDRIIRTVKLGPVAGLIREVSGRFMEGSPVTKLLKNSNGFFTGATQSLTLDRKRAQTLDLRLQILAQASDGYWGESDYNFHEGDESPYFDPQKDHGQPLVIAASVEKGALSDTRVQVDSSRMVVVGNCEFLADSSLSEANANLDFALGIIDWLLNREELIGIAPKANMSLSLNLTDKQTSNIGTFVVAVIPGVVAFFGLVLWWRRRR